jgi:hypothetical protein
LFKLCIALLTIIPDNTLKTKVILQVSATSTFGYTCTVVTRRENMKNLVILLALILMTHTSLANEEVIVKVPLQQQPNKTTEKQLTDTKHFCSKTSEADAEQKCQTWLQSQKTSLGTRLLTSHCSAGEISSIDGCLYRAEGEVRYVIAREK